MLDLFPTFLGNIEKCPFTYWLNGTWFLHMVDIGTFNMKLNGRWFPQIVDSTVGIYIQYIISYTHTQLIRYSHTLYCDTAINSCIVHLHQSMSAYNQRTQPMSNLPLAYSAYA